MILTQDQQSDFATKGIIVIPNFLSQDMVRHLTEAIDRVHADEPYTDKGRWYLRGCLNRHPSFLELLVNERLLLILVQLLDFNIKLLGSQVVKMETRLDGEPLAVDWHRDGGALSAELSELAHPLPKAFLKVAFCVSGSQQPDSGELLMVPGSNSFIGTPVLNTETGWPLGFTRVLTSPGDAVIFDWRTWHAVTRNSTEVIRRTLYFTFGYRWLSPMDYQIMPDELLRKSPIHWQLLGGCSELGNYLPGDDELPLRRFCLDPLRRNGKTTRKLDSGVVVDELKEQNESWQHLLVMERARSQNAMIAKAILNRTT